MPRTEPVLGSAHAEGAEVIGSSQRYLAAHRVLRRHNMKLQIALIALSMTVVLVMVFQAVRQELDLRNLKGRMLYATNEIKKKEDAIVQLKDKILKLRASLMPSNAKLEQLKKKQQDTVKATDDFEKSLKTCTTEKEDAEKKKTSMKEALDKLNTDHSSAKSQAEQDIQNLKQQILDRDKAICAFADTTNAQAQKLCAVA